MRDRSREREEADERDKERAERILGDKDLILSGGREREREREEGGGGGGGHMTWLISDRFSPSI